MVKEIVEEVAIDDDLFFINGIKSFIKEYKNEKNVSNEKVYFKRYYDIKRNTMTYIKRKKKEYSEKIILVENNINLLNRTFKELEIEKNIRCETIKLNVESDFYIEQLDDIIDAINENKRIIMYENRKLDSLKKEYDDFNNSFFDDEREVKIFLKYIKREFLRERKRIIEGLNSSGLNEAEIILKYECLLLITKKIILIQEELING